MGPAQSRVVCPTGSHVLWSRPHTSESVSRRDPPILSILILHSPMDLVAAAQLNFPVACTDASLLSNCSAHVTEMLLCCSAFASLDQKSSVASSHFHSSTRNWFSSWRLLRNCPILFDSVPTPDSYDPEQRWCYSMNLCISASASVCLPVVCLPVGASDGAPSWRFDYRLR